jgi:HEAT repeat protein
VTAALLALALAVAPSPDAGVHERLRQVVTSGKSGPEVVPLLVQTLRQCRREARPGRADASAARDTDDGLTAASLLVAIIGERPSAPEVQALRPELLRGLDCGDAGVRRLCARALGRLGRLEPSELADLRRRLAGDSRSDGRALAAAILAATASADPKSVQALERALSDRAPSVQLSSASALLQLGRPERARPALQRLSRGKDLEIAAMAASVLRSPP